MVMRARAYLRAPDLADAEWSKKRKTRTRVSARERVIGGERDKTLTEIVGREIRLSQETRLRVSARSRVIGGERDKTPSRCHVFVPMPPVEQIFRKILRPPYPT